MANISAQEGYVTSLGSSISSTILEDVWKRYYNKHGKNDDPLLLQDNTSLLLLVVFAIGIVVLTVLFRTRQIQKGGKRKQKLQRSVSFTSSMMAARTTPQHVDMPECIINIYIEFETCPTLEDVRELVVSKMLQYERLAKVPVLEGRQLAFRDDIAYDPNRLVRKINIQCEEEKDMIQTMQDHLHDPLDDAKARGTLLPWWEIVVFQNSKGSSACLWRIHHALGDGISLATVAQNILRFADGSRVTSVVPEGMMERKRLSTQNKLPWYTLAYRLCRATVQVFSSPYATPDHDTVFSKGVHYNMTHNRNREIVVFPTLPLDFVKAIKNAAKVSINDVLFTCLSQAIRDYLEEQDCPVARERGANLLCNAVLAAVLPRSIHDAATETLQNKWFFLACDLGVGASEGNDVLERLRYLHRSLSELKTSPVPIIGLAVQNHLAPWMPRWANEQCIWRFLSSRSVSISNVPGPGRTCLFAKRPGSKVHMFLSNALPHVAFISYAGRVFGNITIDPEAIPDGQSLARHLRNAVVALAQRLDVPVPDELLKQQQPQVQQAAAVGQ